ncbi:MAG: winged helix-turn-helix transcriptional regulator [Oscillospiraceae bacterium]|nr:winged helix-turn-helix transcriptional regulator [Oscillospiraceae bacterium]
MESRYELFSAAISSMHHDIQKIERMEMAHYGLKGPHAQCLLALRRYPEGLTAARLCEVCEKDKAAISRILTELESAGMVTREQKNGSRYRAALYLTPQGHAAAQAVVEKARLAVELAGTGFNDAEREIFYRVLTIIAGNLHSICREGLNKDPL